MSRQRFLSQSRYVPIAVFGLLLSGCVTPTVYSKTITVYKDAEGHIVGSQEVEAIVQPQGRGYPVHFEHLTGVQP
jgi:hypothetical protein